MSYRENDRQPDDSDGGSQFKNTTSRFLNNLNSVSDTMTKLDIVLGQHRFDRFAKLLRNLDIHANPENSAFNYYVKDKSKNEFIWLMLASCGQELQAAWHMVRIAHLGASKRCLRVALEMFSAAIVEGMPISYVREIWKDCPKARFPIRQMYIPRCYYEEGASSKPLIQTSSFPKVLQLLLPSFPLWDESKTNKLEEILSTQLHPFAHGSAQNVAIFLTPFKPENPIFGAVFDPLQPQLYEENADEVINMAKLMGSILYSASSYIQKTGKPNI